MTWRMRWRNRSVATINATLQLLDIYYYYYYYYYYYLYSFDIIWIQLPFILLSTLTLTAKKKTYIEFKFSSYRILPSI